MKYAFIECSQLRKVRYCVELKDDHPVEYARDVVTCREATIIDDEFIDELQFGERIFDDKQSVVDHIRATNSRLADPAIDDGDLAKYYITAVDDWER